MDPDGDREQVTGRLLDYYQHAAAQAQALLARHVDAAAAPAAGPRPAAIPVLANQEQALAWARAERTSLLACLDQATAAGQDARVVALGQVNALTSLGKVALVTGDYPRAGP